MRPIKFRAWHPDTREMLTPQEMSGMTLGHLETDRNLVVMQYTGLKDKNGVEIYEGDILGDTYEPLQVAWCHKQGGYELHDGRDCYACSGDIVWHEVVHDNEGFAVIGNIYQNPELLATKGKNDNENSNSI